MFCKMSKNAYFHAFLAPVRSNDENSHIFLFPEARMHYRCQIWLKIIFPSSFIGKSHIRALPKVFLLPELLDGAISYIVDSMKMLKFAAFHQNLTNIVIFEWSSWCKARFHKMHISMTFR